MIHENGAARANAWLTFQSFCRDALMNVLLIGSGGREHALAWKLAASPLLTKLYCAPGNPGIAEEAECVPLDVADHAAVIRLLHATTRSIWSWSGPEAPLVAGLADDLRAAGIKCLRPVARRPRGWKARRASPRICAPSYGIPTAAYGRFTDARGGQGLSRPSKARRSSSRPTASPPARA